jgi:hypothetical protein
MRLAVLGQGLVSLGIALAVPAAAAPADIARANPAETVTQTTCRIVESAAPASHIPVELLTRLVWVESRFHAHVTSPAGAQGIAQFMPETAAERGLADPFDPEQAIPEAAKLLADLADQFGNIGLATAAYNAGPARVAMWLGGSGSLPSQTEAYVLHVTGRTAEEWAADSREAARADTLADQQSCIGITAALQAQEAADPIPVAPWGVQLSGNFSKATALASFDRARQRYSRILGDLQPMIIGGILRSRGTRRFYRVLVPASSRAEADHICAGIEADGGACVALRS